jgi:DNA-binding NarL/FixJ family response regulator
MAGTQMPEGKSRILLVDDHAVVRRGLAQLIQDQLGYEICGQAEGVGEALELLESTNPDLVVIDLALKDGHGLDLIKDIASRDHPPRMLVMSMHDEPAYAERALRAGAAGYLPKSEAVDQIVEAIRRVLGGEVYLTPRMTTCFLRSKRGGDASTAPEDVLSDRELQVFELLGSGLSSREISTRLMVSIKTVDTHREHIKIKLGLGSGNELVRQATLWLHSLRSVKAPEANA